MELPRLTVLNEQFAIRSVLGELGPFEAIYLAWDLTNEEQVVVREYLPAALVERAASGTHLIPKSDEYKVLFDYGFQRFNKELSLTATISHPNVVRIRNYFTENNTLYSVYDYHPGASLENVLIQHEGSVSARTAVTIMMPFMDGVRVGHKAGLIHGTISPQNVYLSKTGRPMVLSFKTTYLLLANRAQLLGSIQQPGFSPPEQYILRGKHGPWSDVYGSAATLFSMLTGDVLADVSDRIEGDLVPDIIAETPSVPERMKSVLIKALSLEVSQRYQDIDAFCAALTESMTPPGTASAGGSIEKSSEASANTSSELRSSSGSPQEDTYTEIESAPYSSSRTKGPHTPDQSQAYSDTFEMEGSYSYDSYSSEFDLSPFYESSSPGNGQNDSYEASSRSSAGSFELPSLPEHIQLIESDRSLPREESSDAYDETSSNTRTYEEIEPESAFEHGSQKSKRSFGVGRLLLFVTAAGLLIALSYMVYSRFQSPSTETYGFNDNDNAYNMIVARGDSLFDLGFDVAATSNPEKARDILDDALENYLAAQSLFRNDLAVRQRINKIRTFLEASPVENDLDEKASLSFISTGDSLLRIADALVLQGDSVSARPLYREAYNKYLKVFEAFPNDSLASARLKQASERMTAPTVKARPAENTPPPAPTEEQIQRQLFTSFKARGDSAFKNRDFDEARRKYLEALEQKPGDPEVTRLLAETERQLAASEKLGMYRQHINAGNRLKSAGRLAEARREFELALEIMPDDDAAKQAIFEIESVQGEQIRREQNYLSYRTRGDLLLEQKQYDEALKSYEAALLAKPDDEYAKIKIDETKKDIEALKELTEELPEGMVDENGIYNYTEEPPELIGGRGILQSRLRYPARAMEAGIEGRVTVRMIVDETGEMRNPTILKGLGYGCDEEVMRVIRGARFKPGRVGGQPVPSWHTLFFEFTL